MNLLDPFIAQVRRIPERKAIITQSDSITFAELDAQSNNLALNFQKKSLQQGDNVLVLQPFGIPLYVTLLALFRIGAVAVFSDPSAHIRVMSHCCQIVPVKGFCGGWKAHLIKLYFPLLRRIPLSLPLCADKAVRKSVVVDLNGSHPALITFTSGSTGRPKGIVRSHDFLLKQHHMISEMLSPADDDVELISLPVFILSNLASGVTSVIPAGNLKRPGMVDPVPILSQIERHNVNRILLPPALCRRLVDIKSVQPFIKKIFTGGGPVFPDLLQRLATWAPNAETTAVYGSTEAEPIAHVKFSEINNADFQKMKTGDGLLAGSPVAGAHIQIIHDEIHVTGDHVIKGYIDKNDNASTKVEIDGKIWHKTGDAGRWDDQGRLWLLGRVEARQGNIYPFCIETAARTMTDIRHAAFLNHKGRNVLAVEMDGATEALSPLKDKFGDFDIIKIRSMPLDRRHNSKIDYPRLRKLLA